MDPDNQAAAAAAVVKPGGAVWLEQLGPAGIAALADLATRCVMLHTWFLWLCIVCMLLKSNFNYGTCRCAFVQCVS
jgi:hypothetical protein